MHSKSDLGKDEAIALLAGAPGKGAKAKAAKVMGISRQSIGAWPDPLPQRIADRVRGVLSRRPRQGASQASSANGT